MSLDILPSDLLSAIIFYLSPYEILLINRISHHFEDFSQSSYYRNILISNINMNLIFNEYSLSQLKNIFLMTKRKNLSKYYLLNEGSLFYINCADKSIEPCLDDNYFIQVIKGSFLDDNGYIYYRKLGKNKSFLTGRVKHVNNVAKLLGNGVLLHKDGKYSHGLEPRFDSNIIKYDVYGIGNEGFLYCSNGSIFNNSRRFIQSDLMMLLDSAGNSYIIDVNEKIKPINNTFNIISVAYCGDYVALLLDNRGKVYFFNTLNIEDHEADENKNNSFGIE